MVSESSETVALTFCGAEVRLEASSFELIARHDNVAAFIASSRSAAASFVLGIGCGIGSGWVAFEPVGGAIGRFRHVPTGIEVSADANALGHALALRGLFSLAIERKGGVLVHASCVSWNGKAALVTGVSGTGKSTLARWATKTGATLLSDEVVGVLPDGCVLGTPFRSDPDLLGTPTTSRLAVVTTVRHADHESFEALPAHRVLPVLLEQTFHRGGEVTARQALSCLGPALDGVRTGVLSCRNSIEAAYALRDLVLVTPGSDIT